MFLHWLGQPVKPSARSSGRGYRAVRRDAGFRPRVEVLEDRTVLSSLQPGVLQIPSGPCVGQLAATASVISFPTGPCAAHRGVG
jgi:hypothetical protein